MDQIRLTHLRQLEAESIHIIREVAAEFSNPVMLYSIGKDSSVMLHLARKAFYPGTLPFPLLHVDTGWKFREMYEFRDRTAKAYGCELLVHKNPEGVAMGLLPTETLSLKVTTAGAVTATMSFDTGKKSKGKAVIYKATCSTVVIPLTLPDEEAFKGAAFLFFAPSPKNNFLGLATAAPFGY